MDFRVRKRKEKMKNIVSIFISFLGGASSVVTVTSTKTIQERVQVCQCDAISLLSTHSTFSTYDWCLLLLFWMFSHSFLSVVTTYLILYTMPTSQTKNTAKALMLTFLCWKFTFYLLFFVFLFHCLRFFGSHIFSRFLLDFFAWCCL